jgi:hypothetical protein
MDLLDRYLANVGLLLPFADREDIIAELRDILLCQMEDRETSLGRPLTPDEREEVIRAFGHPLLIAGRYRPERHLIGPAVYPLWLISLQMGAAIIFCVAVVLGVFEAIHTGIAHWIFGYGVRTFFVLFGATTLWCAAFERTALKRGRLMSWRPSRLPMVVKPRKSRRADLIGEIVSGIVVLAIMTSPSMQPTAHGAAADIVMTPILTALYWPILIFLAARIASNALELFQIGALVPRRLFSIAVNLAGVAICVCGLTTGPWIDLLISGGAGLPAAVREAGPWVHVAATNPVAGGKVSLGVIINMSIGWAFVGVLIAMLIKTGQDVWAIIRRR